MPVSSVAMVDAMQWPRCCEATESSIMMAGDNAIDATLQIAQEFCIDGKRRRDERCVADRLGTL